MWLLCILTLRPFLGRSTSIFPLAFNLKLIQWASPGPLPPASCAFFPFERSGTVNIYLRQQLLAGDWWGDTRILRRGLTTISHVSCSGGLNMLGSLPASPNDPLTQGALRRLYSLYIDYLSMLQNHHTCAHKIPVCGKSRREIDATPTCGLARWGPGQAGQTASSSPGQLHHRS